MVLFSAEWLRAADKRNIMTKKNTASAKKTVMDCLISDYICDIFDVMGFLK